MTTTGDRAVLGIALVAAGVLLVDLAGLTAERWAELEMAKHPQTVCDLQAGRNVCIDLPVRS